MRNLFILSILILASWSCSGDLDPRQTNNSREYFFDATSFFEEESKRLETENARLKKIVRLDGKEESRIQADIDWEAELAPFRNSDINRPAWTDKYRGDTLYYEKGGAEQFIYQALGEDLLVQQMEVHWSPAGQVERILIRKRISSLIEQVQQELQYRPVEGYTFVEKSQSRWKPDRDLKIEAFFQ
jgi:hypothetical protein